MASVITGLLPTERFWGKDHDAKLINQQRAFKATLAFDNVLFGAAAIVGLLILFNVIKLNPTVSPAASFALIGGGGAMFALYALPTDIARIVQRKQHHTV